MKDLKNFRLEVWTDGRWDMCSIRAERENDASGLRWIWFVLDRSDLEAIVAGKSSTAEDGYHKLAIFGDLWTFYDMEMPRETSGVMSVPFCRVEIPRTFAKVLLRVARWTWRMQRRHGTDENRGEKLILDFSEAHRARICRLYGQGKGEVEWRCTPETRTLIADLRAENKGFADNIDRLEQIAKNTTRGFHEHATVSISKDGNGFFWNALTPQGRSTLVGGLVNHARVPFEHDWSLHT